MNKKLFILTVILSSNFVANVVAMRTPRRPRLESEAKVPNAPRKAHGRRSQIPEEDLRAVSRILFTQAKN